MSTIINKIEDYALEDIMGRRFADYSKAIIQDRAIPDVRDGLKPVQRRILYAMYRGGNTYDKATRKSARSVGDIMGKYHPHGDSSIYEAMVRMSQWWKQNACYIEMQGNNGSMDGDGAAAMRYTEARLSKISNELLKDIDKNTVEMVNNFDDTLKEPTVLPARYPNLLVNGSTGISAGYATNIPPHNLGEVIDATIKRIDSPNCRLDTLLEIIKGPDFPTGGIACGKNGILEAFETGRGRIVVKSKTEFIRENGHDQILITEIPFEVNKLLLVKKIGDLVYDKKIEGIIEARDESDRENPVRIIIDLKKGANKELILNYLLKNTDLQVAYNYNMVAIVNRRPMTIGIIPMLDAYIAHQKEVVTRRSKYDLDYAAAQMHIVEGLMKALSILDDVIKTIRASKNKANAIENLVAEYGFTEKQADAIVTLQLYRLTNTDILELQERHKNLGLIIANLTEILEDENKLKNVMKDELRQIKKEYATPRKTEIQDEVEEIKIEPLKMIPKEDCIVTVSKEGYVKRTSLRSFDEQTLPTLKEGDYTLLTAKMSTMDTLLLFTDLGNFLFVPVHELPDLKWKDLGKHISNLIAIKADENVIYAYPVSNFDNAKDVTIFTKNGMVKRSELKEFKVQRYSKPISCMKLKEDDKVVSVVISDDEKVFITTRNGYGLAYQKEEIPVTGIKSSGVKAISLKNDIVVSGCLYNDNYEYLTLFTEKGTAKRVHLEEFELTSRARRGILTLREVKTNPYYILKSFIIHYKETVGYKTVSSMGEIKLTEIPIQDRHATGSSISKAALKDVYLITTMTEPQTDKEAILPKENVSLENIDDKMMTIDDFLDHFEV